MANKPTKPPVLTRKRLVGLKQEADKSRLLMIGTIAIVVIVIVLVGWTYALDAIIYPGQTVAIVENEEIKGQEFMERARYNRQQVLVSYEQTYAEYQQLAAMFGSDPTFTQSYSNVFLQLQNQLDPEVSGQFAVDQLVNERLLDLEAAELGISVSEAEVDAEIQNLFGFYPDGTPTPVTIPTTAPTSTLSAAQLAVITATATASVTPTASITPTASATPEGAATQPPAPSATATFAIVASATPGPTLTPTEYTREGFETALSGLYDSYSRFVGVEQAAIREIVRSSLVRLKVKEHLTADLPRMQEQVWARHILVGSEEEALTIIAQIENGEDFATLAAATSTDGSASAGGDLGWFPIEAMVDPFANAAFALQIGEISDPVESEFGWHVIQVLGHEERPLSATQYEELRDRILEEFILSLRSKYEWQIFDTWKAMSPEEPGLE
jgi:peptidyl-prolyl cis-trans isomerase D